MQYAMKTAFQKSSGLYAQVAETLRQEIRTRHRPGDRLQSVRQLAAVLGVSCNTLRGALAVLAREGLVVSHHGRGTFVQASLAPERHVAILSELDISHPACSYYFRRVPQVLRLLLREHGVPARPYIGHMAPTLAANPEAYVCHEFYEELEAGRLSGVIEFNTDFRTRPRLEAAVRRHRLPWVPGGFADLGRDRFVRTGLDHLQDAGCRRIAVLGHFSQPADSGHLAKLYAECGLDFRPDWVRGDLQPGASGAGWEEFMELWAARRQKPDGLLVLDDMLFNDASKAILALHLDVPGQLRVLTHSNKGSGLYAPFPVGQLEVDPDFVADVLSRRLLDVLSGPADERPPVPVPFTFIPAPGPVPSAALVLARE